MSKETTAKVARLAARFLNGKINTMTRKQLLSICASCVSQAEAEQESGRAWGIINYDDKFAAAFPLRGTAVQHRIDGLQSIEPVLITRLRPARADTRKRKRG